MSIPFADAKSVRQERISALRPGIGENGERSVEGGCVEQVGVLGGVQEWERAHF